MKVQSIGHAVLKVRNLDTAEAFYNGVLGMPIATRNEDLKMTFFTLGNHHDFAVVAVGNEAPRPPRESTGLFHVALKVGDTIEELREVRDHLQANNVKIDAIIDHEVSKAIYLRDPDGNGIELYVDAEETWKEDPSRVAQGAPLAL